MIKYNMYRFTERVEYSKKIVDKTLPQRYQYQCPNLPVHTNTEQFIV